MIELKNNELTNISGGVLSGTLVNAAINGARILLELGRSVGSAIRRFVLGIYC
jgi:hypothetical protein